LKDEITGNYLELSNSKLNPTVKAKTVKMLRNRRDLMIEIKKKLTGNH